MSRPFQLDPRLAADSLPVTCLEICDVRLMNDCRYPWLILIPRRADLREITDLAPADYLRFSHELHQVATVLQQVTPCHKLNIGALGNLVAQLHIHVLARQPTDPAWPGPVWGHSPAAAYPPKQADDLIARLQQSLGA